MPGSFLEARILHALRRKLRVPIRLVLWDNSEVALGVGAPVATVRIADRNALFSLATDPETNFGDLYSDGRIAIEGDLLRVLIEAYRASSRHPSWYGRLISAWLNWRYRPTLHRARRNIHHHYDIGTPFYQLWLDDTLNYTCAYFPSPDASLEEAQVAKMDLVCRKLRLQPGETVVEAGCGWGALALHMVRNYGVRVRSFNISPDQIRYARRRAQEEGLAASVEYIEDDYRNIAGTCDVFVSLSLIHI